MYTPKWSLNKNEPKYLPACRWCSNHNMQRSEMWFLHCCAIITGQCASIYLRILRKYEWVLSALWHYDLRVLPGQSWIRIWHCIICKMPKMHHFKQSSPWAYEKLRNGGASRKGKENHSALAWKTGEDKIEREIKVKIKRRAKIWSLLFRWGKS